MKTDEQLLTEAPDLPADFHVGSGDVIEAFKEAYLSWRKEVKEALEPKYHLFRVRFVFEGNFGIQARSESQALEFLEKFCTMTAGEGIKVDSKELEVDYDFPANAEKTILKAT